MLLSVHPWRPTLVTPLPSKPGSAVLPMGGSTIPPPFYSQTSRPSAPHCASQYTRVSFVIAYLFCYRLLLSSMYLKDSHMVNWLCDNAVVPEGLTVKSNQELRWMCVLCETEYTKRVDRQFTGCCSKRCAAQRRHQGTDIGAARLH